MLTRFLSIAKPAESEIIEKKSRFIGYACPVETEEEANAFISSIKNKHKEATHNCYAYQMGRQDQLQRSSDDGEPAGTAGRPILEIIKKSGLKNTAVVVTRYFGGILLGAGGLVRAYSKAAQAALAAAGIVEKIPACLYSATMDYSLWGKVEHFLQQRGLQTKEVIFMEKVTALILIPQEEAEGVCKDLAELSNQTISLMALENEIWLEQPFQPSL